MGPAMPGRASRILVWLALLAAALPRVQAAEAAGAVVSDTFALSASELETMTRSLPLEIGTLIRREPRDFLRLVAEVLDEPRELFVLVDKRHQLPSDFAPDDLVKLTSHSLPVSMGDVLLRKAIMPAVLEMAGAAKEAGITLVFSSGYRSFEYQKYVYAREVKTYGQEDGGPGIGAGPGCIPAPARHRRRFRLHHG